MSLLKKIFGSRNEREMKRLSKIVLKINALESGVKSLSDAQLSAKTLEFRDRLSKGETLAQLLPEVFSVVREASVRVLGMRHFDVQLIGGMVLHSGKIAEMRTGEGKTLVATLPAYLNALTGQSVHVITVNDYLVTRDANWMRPLYEFLGLSLGIVIAGMTPADKQKAYAADITYATNNELGFDYLRDNMVHSLGEKVQRPLYFAVVDEVDSVLIDEARTPLIISGATEDSSSLYKAIDKLVFPLEEQKEKDGPGDFSVDGKTRQVFLTEAGHQRVEELLTEAALLPVGESLYAVKNISLMHHVDVALRARWVFHRDVDYIVQNNEVMLVDEHTGRTMPGRRWSDGLHQAVEAKENVAIQSENQTLASVTFQNYFRLYDKLSGMTGTADTEAFELQQTYGLEVIVIPTNQTMVRRDEQDFIYLQKEHKFKAVITDIKDSVAKGAPVLVGTVSIETSELVSGLLTKEGIAHQVLNAKFHQKEAHIIAQAGRLGAVTIATNMAGRGTDIVLGGNQKFMIEALENPTEEQIAQIKKQCQEEHEQVIQAGGLRIIGTERHESRRIDNQLRGRAGRQGDPGSSRFYISMEDDLMRLFGGERMQFMLKTLGMGDGQPISHSMISNSIEKAQRKVEGRNFELRKNLIEYDDVTNMQRQLIYAERNRILAMTEASDDVAAMLVRVVDQLCDQHIPEHSMPEQWDLDGLEKQLIADFGIQIALLKWLDEDETRDSSALRTHLQDVFSKVYDNKKTSLGVNVMSQVERSIMLQCIDARWLAHMSAIDDLRHGIGLRSYAQKNPKQEFKRESGELFAHMQIGIRYDIVTHVFRVQLAPREEAVQSPLFVPPNISRNDPCPCGSGQRFKACHGAL